MKKTTLLSAALLAGLSLMPGYVGAQTSADADPDVVTLTTSKAAGDELTFTVNSGTFTVDWGDGNAVEVKSTGEPITGTLMGNTVTISANTITYLDCSSSELTAIKVSDAPYLKTLNCSDNSLTDIGVQSNGYLEDLDCSGNKLSYISLSSQRNLKTFNCSNNEFTSLSLSSATGLKILICNDNKLANMSFSGLSALETVWCYNNSLKSLNFSSNTNLQSVVCDGNQLTEIQMAGNGAKVVDFWCNNNSLETLDLSQSSQLETLSCTDNQLTSLSLAALTDHQALAVYLKNNQLVFSDFYSPENVADYVYGPQDPFSLSKSSVSVGESVAIPSFEKNVDGQSINASVRWINSLTDEELVYGRTEDYTSRSVNYTFMKPFESICCAVTSSLYPDIELVSKPLKVVDPTGIKDINAEVGFVCSARDGRLYMSADKAYFVHVYAADGKLVWSGTVTNTGVSITLGSGVYIANGVKVSL